MKRVYLVSTGEYSDYRIIGIFSSLPTAEAFRDQYNEGAEYQFETANEEIQEFAIDVPRKQWIAWEVWMKKNGDLLKGHLAPKREVATDHKAAVDFANDGTLISTVITDSEERAIKVTNERRAAMLAAGTWGRVDKPKLVACNEG